MCTRCGTLCVPCTVKRIKAARAGNRVAVTLNWELAAIAAVHRGLAGSCFRASTPDLGNAPAETHCPSSMASYPESSARTVHRASAFSTSSSASVGNVETTAISLTRIGALIAQVTGDAALGELLEAVGYARSELDAGLALHVAAEEQFNACERTHAMCGALAARRDEVWTKAQREFVLFQARVALPGQIRSGQVTRGGRVRRQSVAAFVAEAEAAYTRQGSRRYTGLLDRYGFSPERIRFARELLKTLQTLETQLSEARAGLKRLQEARSVSLVMLNHWLHELFKHLRVALGQTRHPPLPSAAGEHGVEKRSAPKRRRAGDR